MTQIAHVQTKDDLNQVKVLFQEYADSLGFDLCFQDFEGELRSLPGNYSPPGGALLVAKQEGDIIGCVAVRPLSSEVCEMKRLYVRPEHRGKGIGRVLATTIIEEAAKSGYKAMRLDTLPSMKEAVRLYESLGFQPTRPYCHNPIPGAMYFQLNLRQGKDGTTR
jgi:putative acetyltransferase